MLTSYVLMIPTKWKTTEEVIKVYLRNVYSVFGHSKYILSDRGGEFTSKQFTWLAKELVLIKVYTSPQTPTGNSVIECIHFFPKSTNKKTHL